MSSRNYINSNEFTIKTYSEFTSALPYIEDDLLRYLCAMIKCEIARREKNANKK